MLKLTTHSEAETAQLARLFASFLKTGDCVAFFATLGMGKSVFCRHIIQSLNPHITHVPSPTFTLVQTYETSLGDIWHFDLYRLENPEDVFELGLDEALSSAISLIEWPQNMGELLPTDAIEIHISPRDEENSRLIEIKNARLSPQDVKDFLA